MQRVALGDSATMRAATRVNTEQASKGADAGADPAGERGRLASAGKRAMKAPVDPAGAMAAATREALSVVSTRQPEPREGQAGPAGWRMGSWYRGCRVIPAEERGPGSRAMRKGEKDMTTGDRLPGSEKVRRLRTVSQAKAGEEPDRRFHALIDRVWREDFLAEAWRRVRRSGRRDLRGHRVAWRGTPAWGRCGRF